jgi:superfamily II DNA or RNA helicase
VPNPLVLRLDPQAGSGLRATLLSRPLGTGGEHPPGEGPVHLVGVIDGVRKHATRDLAQERHRAEQIALELGLDRAVHEGGFVYRIDDADDAAALLETLAARPELVPAEWPDDASAWRVGRMDTQNFAVVVRNAQHWFEVSGSVDQERVDLARILVALRRRKRYVQLAKGRFVRIADELRAQLETLDPVLHLGKDGVRTGAEAILVIEAALGKDRIDGDAAWDALSTRLEASKTAQHAMPDGLRAELRDYQREGVEWLLRTSGWARGMCLADEMGLGKTVQTIAILLSRAAHGPSLVVCPTSISDNWRRECERFAPSLRTVLYRGAGRAKALESLSPGDVLIASYDVGARDAEALSKIELASLVLDEAQAIKNPGALRTRAVRSLSAGVKIALTGTPIENRLSELWSLFSILAPGLFDTWEEFRARFAVPIERNGDKEKLVELRSLLRPFLLRRTKAMVERELPPRVEVVRSVDLSEEERALYEAERTSALDSLEKRRGDPDFRFALLAVLTRMRRLVCDPALVFDDTTVKSSKIEELLVLLEDLRREAHRALVFSQFTSLLARVRKVLDARRVPYLYLDGSTPGAARMDLVDRWQNGDEPFFLISLKAGGTGLNLTAADYVVHLDPWWNPAVEDQASDRAHRIGQTKPVTVVRLVAQDTIEERVLEMHEAKRKLASGLLEGAEANAAIDTDALLELLGESQRGRTKWRRSSGRAAT